MRFCRIDVVTWWTCRELGSAEKWVAGVTAHQPSPLRRPSTSPPTLATRAPLLAPSQTKFSLLFFPFLSGIY